jgi:hypothetical protein
MEAFLLKLLIFLGAATIAVPLARKFKLGSVLGYLIAGIVIGPFGLTLIDDIEAVMHFTEFGVFMMLFLVGLELRPSLLWQMRTPILGMGGSQVLLTFIAIGLVSMFFLPWQQSAAIGMILALSSTALTLCQDALQLLGFDPYEAYKIRRLFRKKDKETMPELYRIHRQDEDKYISMYQQHNANLAELMTKDREIDMEELDKAWTAANPET